MTNLSALSELLIEKRGNAGIRPTAKEIGISPTTLLRLERGCPPDPRSLERVCGWLGCRVELSFDSDEEEETDFRDAVEIDGVPIAWKHWTDGNSELTTAQIGRYWLSVFNFDDDGSKWRVESNNRLIAADTSYDAYHFEECGQAALATVGHLIQADKPAAKESRRITAPGDPD